MAVQKVKAVAVNTNSKSNETDNKRVEITGRTTERTWDFMHNCWTTPKLQSGWDFRYSN